MEMILDESPQPNQSCEISQFNFDAQKFRYPRVCCRIQTNILTVRYFKMVQCLQFHVKNPTLHLSLHCPISPAMFVMGSTLNKQLAFSF